MALALASVRRKLIQHWKAHIHPFSTIKMRRQTSGLLVPLPYPSWKLYSEGPQFCGNVGVTYYRADRIDSRSSRKERWYVIPDGRTRCGKSVRYRCAPRIANDISKRAPNLHPKSKLKRPWIARRPWGLFCVCFLYVTYLLVNTHMHISDDCYFLSLFFRFVFAFFFLLLLHPVPLGATRSLKGCFLRCRVLKSRIGFDNAVQDTFINVLYQ